MGLKGGGCDTDGGCRADGDNRIGRRDGYRRRCWNSAPKRPQMRRPRAQETDRELMTGPSEWEWGPASLSSASSGSRNLSGEGRGTSRYVRKW